MSLFDNFLEEESELIISIPYRAGLWMSRADDIEGTQRDDLDEERTLELILKDIAKRKSKAPFISDVAQEILRLKHNWPRWKEQDEKFLDDVKKVIKLLNEQLPKENVQNYKKGVFEIARMVTLAFCELNTVSDDLRQETLLGGLLTKINHGFSMQGLDWDQSPINISDRERKALRELERVLKQ